MAAVDHLLHARRELDALAGLLRQAVRDRQPAEAIAEEALGRLEEARRVLASMADPEGTE